MTTNGQTKKVLETGARLRIGIVGAGIGGLCSAISLRQQGHEVFVSELEYPIHRGLTMIQIYESSRFATETGAAMHIPPNAYGLLLRMGINPGSFGANPCESVRANTEVVVSDNN